MSQRNNRHPPRLLESDGVDPDLPDLVEADDHDAVDAVEPSDDLHLPHPLEEDEEDERELEAEDLKNIMEAQQDLQRIRQQKKQRRRKKKTKPKNPGSVSRAITIENRIMSTLKTPCCKKWKCYKRYHFCSFAHVVLDFSLCRPLTDTRFV